MLVGNRTEKRPLEIVFGFLLKPVQIISPTLMHTPIEILAKSMIANTIYSSDQKNELLFNIQIFDSAKLYEQITKA